MGETLPSMTKLFSVHRSASLSILINVPQSIGSHVVFVPSVATFNPDVKVSHQDNICLWIPLYDGLQSVVELVFVYFLAVIGRSEAVYDVKLYFLFCFRGLL